MRKPSFHLFLMMAYA